MGQPPTIQGPSIELSHSQLYPDDVALLAGWTAHIEQQKQHISKIVLSDNPLLIAADAAQLEATLGPFFKAVGQAAVSELRLACTGLTVPACNMLVDAMTENQKTKDQSTAFFGIQRFTFDAFK